MAAEIERKFLVDAIPPGLGFASEEPIDQGYLTTGDPEVRLRRRGDRHVITVKRGHGLERDEVEVPLPEASFAELWPLTQGHRLEKTRRTLPLGGLLVELDTYHGPLDGLATVEIEFPDGAAAEAFEPPDWFGRELTGEERYSNQRLALDGLPDEGR